MRHGLSGVLVALASVIVPATASASTVKKIRNDKVLAVEVTLAPGELLASDPERARHAIGLSRHGTARNRTVSIPFVWMRS